MSVTVESILLVRWRMRFYGKKPSLYIMLINSMFLWNLGKEYMELVESTFSGKLSDSKPNASGAKGNHISTPFLPINAANLDSMVNADI